MNNEVEKDMQIFPVVKTTRTLSVRDFTQSAFRYGVFVAPQAYRH